METSPVHSGTIGEAEAVPDPALVRAPYYRAWRDLWKYRFGRDPSFLASRRWLLLATYSGMVGGFALAVYVEIRVGTAFGFVMCAGASGLDEYAKLRRIARGFASCITARPTGDAAELLREDWAAFIAPLGGTRRLLPWNRQVPAYGMWVFDTALIVVIMIPVLASFIDWRVPGVTARHWLFLVLAIPVLFLSRNLFAGIIMRRRHAALTAAYLDDACCWCGHGLSGPIEHSGASDRCPECGSPNPASPPALLPPRG